MRKLVTLLVVLVVLLFLFNAGVNLLSRLDFTKKPLPTLTGEKVKIVTEESVVTDAVKKVGPSVVTVVEESTLGSRSFEFGPFSIFGLPSERGESQQQNIGSGFIVSADGFIITSKHVVSDIGAKYKILTVNDKKYDVLKIFRDPLNDVAILKVDQKQHPQEPLKPVVLGDSSSLVVGQFVIAIGTALGEFRNTVTTGVISGLGRGITAGSQFQGYVERLDNVIQTDAAINPGNSGGPLLNSKAQVIGVNTAVAQSGQNIGFALPINIIKESLKNFNATGQFNRPYLGVAYKVISREIALFNEVAEGAYVLDVVEDSPAEKAGIEKGDIITKIDNQRIQKGNELAVIISKKKVGDKVSIDIFRDGKTINVNVTLSSAPNQ